MSKNRRQDPFRYLFTSPLHCEFHISEIDRKVVSSKIAEAFLLDISKSGCRLATPLDLGSKSHDLKINITLPVDVQGETLTVPAVVRWQSGDESENVYGVSFEAGNNKELMMHAIRALGNDKKIVAQ
jgi:hypothetical protein